METINFLTVLKLFVLISSIKEKKSLSLDEYFLVIKALKIIKQLKMEEFAYNNKLVIEGLSQKLDNIFYKVLIEQELKKAGNVSDFFILENSSNIEIKKGKEGYSHLILDERKYGFPSKLIKGKKLTGSLLIDIAHAQAS